MKTILKRITLVTFLGLILSCSNDSSCVPITCLNGGTATPDCGCNCPEGYFGTDCSSEKMPAKILISKIRINKFPNDGGGVDDLGTNPDLFISLIKDNSNIYTSTTYFSNANGDGSINYDYSFTTPIECTVASPLFLLELWDYDSNTNNDLMGTIVVSPYLNFKGFPSSIIIQDDNKNFIGEIFVTYKW